MDYVQVQLWITPYHSQIFLPFLYFNFHFFFSPSKKKKKLSPFFFFEVIVMVETTLNFSP